MSHSPRRPQPRRHLLWVLWLALLLPLAQAAAAWHEVSHVESVAGQDGKQVLHLGHCDLCLTAAALGGAAPASPALPIETPAATDEAPDGPRAGLWDALAAPPYRSRAPPFARR